ncbi:MAG: hypothetical protein ACW99A_14330 [Candidatus Kariarchaeaceae archaeon]
MNIRLRLATISLVVFFLVQSFNAPITVTSASTSFQVGDEFTFEIDFYDLMVSINDTPQIDSSDHNFLSIGEPVDLNISQITILDVDTSESEILANVSFQNPDIIDPNVSMYVSSKSWEEYLQFGPLLSAILISDFNPNTAIFYDTIVYEDEFYEDPQLQPVNGSVLFPVNGGEMLPFFVDKDESGVNSLYNDYLNLWEFGDAPGTPADGYYNQTTDIVSIDSDVTNRTITLSQYENWDNQTKLFDFNYERDESYLGTYNNNVDNFIAHSFYSFQLKIDLLVGIVREFSQLLTIEYAISGANYTFIFNFGFRGDVISEPTTTRTIITSTSTTTFTRPSTTQTTSGTDVTSEDTVDPKLNFTTPLTIFSTIFIILSYRRKFRN